MIISALKQQVKNPERVSIFVDGKYSFSFSLGEVITYKIKQGVEISAADVKKYKKLSADGKLRDRSLEWLLNRPHSEREFRDYLFRKKAEPDQIENLVNEFTDKGYLDNQKFAVWFIELKARRGKSNRAIKAELFKKGIDREIVEEKLPEPVVGEQERLRQLIAKKQNLSRYKADPQKLMQYLVSKGFSWHAVKEELASNRPEES